MMKTWIKRLAMGLAGVATLGVVVGLILPTEFTVKRSIVIDGGPEGIHEYVGELRKWDLWAPWKEDDPTFVVTFGDKTSGIGASQSWVGADGDGSLEFTASSPRRGIEYDLFFEGGTYKCRSAMRFHPTDESTAVTWIMKGDMSWPIVGGYFAVMLDSAVGPMFERGLAKLKKTVEANTA